MSKATTDLTNDHEAILTALDIFSRILDSTKNPSATLEEDLVDFIHFLQEFVDQCHHGKEEGILFPAMIAVGVLDRGGPIAVMMSEHIQGRGYIHDMVEALEDDPLNFARFEKAGRQYIDLLRVHIQKENTVLFPMADRMIPGVDLERMFAAFEEHEEKVIGRGRHAELHAILDTMNAKYRG